VLRDKDGNRLFRKVTVRVIFPEAIFPPKTFIQHAAARQGFGPEGIDAMLMSIADQLETLYPFWDFRAQELAPEGRTARYVLTFAGYRAAPSAPIPAEPLSNTTEIGGGLIGAEITREAESQ